MFEQSIVSTQLLSSEGDTLRVNQSFCELFGVTPEAMKHYRIFEDNAIKESDAYEPLLDVFNNKVSRRWFNWFDIAHASESSGVKTIRPEKVYLENLSYPILGDKGDLEYVVIQHHDITERKQAKKEKLQAQKIAAEHDNLKSFQRIAGQMAHNFNNILGIIMGNTELALMDCKEPQTKKTLELIFKQTLNGKKLTRNLVVFAKNQEPNQVFFRINEKIDLCLNLLMKDLNGIELQKEFGYEIPELFADSGMIEHVFVNLIQNSIHALSKAEYPIIKIKTYATNGFVCFEIEDNGCGIPEEHLDSIYESTFTLKGSNDVTGSYQNEIKGTGYGMASAKKCIDQHKGKLSIKSEVGVGTKIIISLPIIKKELTKEEKAEIEEVTHFGKRILLVEDEIGIADVQYTILTDEPFYHKVDKADNGQVAMDLFDRNKYDCVSLDYALPGKISGMDIYNHIRKTDQNIPILFISGNVEFLESISELGKTDLFIDHLSKPCQNKDYVNTVGKLLKKRFN